MIRHGATRLVVLVGGFAIKIASPLLGQRHFLYGCLGNVMEREISKVHWRLPIAKTYWCSPLGLVSVQQRVDITYGRRLTAEELQSFFPLHVDDNGQNVADTPNGPILVDYSNAQNFFVLPSPWHRLRWVRKDMRAPEDR